MLLISTVCTLKRKKGVFNKPDSICEKKSAEDLVKDSCSLNIK